MRHRVCSCRLRESISDCRCTLSLRLQRTSYPAVPQADRHSHHLPDDLRLLRMLENACGHGGQRVRLQYDAIPLDMAPATREAIAGLNEVDRAFEFGPPCVFNDFVQG